MAESVVSTGGTFLEKEMRFAPTSLIQSVVFPLSYLPAFWLAVQDRGVWALVAQNVTYNLLFVVGTWWTVRWRMPQLWQVRWQFDAGLARQFIRFGLTVGLMLLAGLLLTQLDNFMIGTFVGITVLGFYDRAYRTAQWPATLLSSLISRAAFYTYARLQGDLARLQKTVTMMLWIITTLALPLALVIFITAPDLIRLLYGDRWLPSTLFLRILVVYAVMRPLWENAGSLFIAIGKPVLTTRFTFIQALVLAVAGLPLTILWGALGTCVAVGMAFVTGLVLTYRQLAREIPVRVLQTLGWPAAIAAVVVFGYWVLNPLVGLNDFPLVVRVAVKSAYAIAGFFGLMVLSQPRATIERVAYIWRLARTTGREGGP
jgi:O-antigen/teichoic acid export membrane protein